MVQELEWISAEKLDDELQRLIDRYLEKNEPVAVEALEMVRWWLQEERVPSA